MFITLYWLIGTINPNFIPELPEVETVVRELNSKLKGLEIFTVEVMDPKVVHVGPEKLSPARKTQPEIVKSFRKYLRAQKIVSVKRRAKLLIFDFQGPWAMIAHLKMTGQFIYEDRKLRAKTKGQYKIINSANAAYETLPGRFTRVILTFTNGARLFFNDIRKFGYLKLVHDTEIPLVADLKEFGPEPLDKKYTYQVFKDSLTKRKTSKIKQVLVDPKVVAGIGNIYSDEILFHAQVRPGRTVKSLSEKELQAIYKNIAPVLKKGIETKGSSVGDYVRTDGSWGSMGKYHFVYGRKGQKCKRCGNIIESVKLGGRTGSFCPHCQR